MTNDIVIVGAGGFGREVAWLIERINAMRPTWNILGFVDDAEWGCVSGWDVLGNTDWLLAYEHPLAVAVAIGSSDARKSVAEKVMANHRLLFPSLVDPSALTSESVRYGKGCIVCAGAILTVDISLGDFCIVNLDCTIGHDAMLRDYVTLYPSVNVSGAVELGACVEMGTGSQVIQFNAVGAKTIVGAGAVVTRDLPSGCVAVGMPAKPVKTRG